jgi:hypothetical protein
MIDWNLVSSILEDLQKIARPEFDDDEKICWMLEQTWKLAQKAERKAVEDLLMEYDMVDSAFAKDFRARGQA